MIFTLNKEERLHGRKIIEELFFKGNSLYKYPIKVVYLKTGFDRKYPVKFGVTVSKKHFKRAVKRNYIKRVFRETFRFEKPEFCKYLIDNNISINCMFIYVGKDFPEFEMIRKMIIDCINDLKINIIK